MSQPCIIRADFAGFRVVAGRKVAQLVMEIAIEESDDALNKLGGIPQPGSSRWCAIALLDLKSSEKTSCAQREPASPGKQQRNTVGVTAGETAPKAQTRFTEKNPSNQAGIRCDDPVFQEYMGVMNMADAAKLVRARCEIETRSELDRNPQAAAAWQKIEAQYQSWLTDRKYAQVAR